MFRIWLWVVLNTCVIFSVYADSASIALLPILTSKRKCKWRKRGRVLVWRRIHLNWARWRVGVGEIAVSGVNPATPIYRDKPRSKLDWFIDTVYVLFRNLSLFASYAMPIRLKRLKQLSMAVSMVVLRGKVCYHCDHSTHYSGFKLATSNFVLSILEFIFKVTSHKHCD